jgi:hypothetical protein
MFDIPPRLSDEFARELTAAVGAVTISSPFAFSFSGAPPINVSAAMLGGAGRTPAQPTDLSAEGLLTSTIQNTLYNLAYSCRIGEPSVRPECAPKTEKDFVQRLSEANTGRERWDSGWTITHLGANGQIFVAKGDRECAALPGTFLSDAAPGKPLQIGGRVRLHAPRESLDLQPGYYYAFGETLDELAERLSQIRFYFHCRADSAASVLAAITSGLNRFQVPFRMKALLRPELYDRTDSLVLYVAARYFAITSRIIELMRERGVLSSSVPLFTKRLWLGIGVAVEPGTGESFGLHRCRLVAEGIVDAWRDGEQDARARLRAVAARFAAAGLDLARPYLGPSGVDLFSRPEQARLP